MTLRWKKSLGQHLLHDQNILRKIIDSLDLSGGNVVEIGSGSGALTEHLIKKQVSVTAVELDEQFFEILREKFSGRDNFRLITGNILDIDLSTVIPGNKKAVVVGNLPYNITSQILFHLFSYREYLAGITIMVQKEVAQRIIAGIRCKDRGIMSVISQFHAEPDLLFTVSRNCFYPKPNVDSAMISLKLRPIPAGVDPVQFFKLVKNCFGKRRKTLRNSLSLLVQADIPGLETVFDLNRRPEELTVSEFVSLAQAVYNS